MDLAVPLRNFAAAASLLATVLRPVPIHWRAEVVAEPVKQPAGRFQPTEDGAIVRDRLRSSITALLIALFFVVGSRASRAQTAAQPASEWQYGGFVDSDYMRDSNSPSNHLFRNRGTTPRVDEVDLNMAGGWIKKTASKRSRWGAELTVHAGRDSETFGFSATAPSLGGADWLRHLGPTNVSYLAPVGTGLTLQVGIFSSFIGYDSLYAKDNFSYTRPWGADYTPYLMMGVNVSYGFSSKLTGTVLLVNGYWHLAHANDVPSAGGQVAYKASDRVTVKETALYGPHQANTSLEFWRFISDTVVERKSDRVTVAIEYQIASEKVDAAGKPRALWTSAQLLLHWTIRGRLALTVRPEFAWDRDGRWIGAPQSVRAVTTTLEYRARHRRGQAILRLEHRLDDSHGVGGGFFNDGEVAPGVVSLTPRQHLLAAGLILTFDSASMRQP
jgi:hypothetical protein